MIQHLHSSGTEHKDGHRQHHKCIVAAVVGRKAQDKLASNSEGIEPAALKIMLGSRHQ